MFVRCAHWFQSSTVKRALLSSAIVVGMGPSLAQQPAAPARPATPSPSGAWTAGTDVRQQPPTAPTSGWATTIPAAKVPTVPVPIEKVPSEKALPNTTVMQRAPVEGKSTTGLVTMVAHLTDDGQPLDQGVIWRVFREKGGADGKPKLVTQLRDAAPAAKLDPGDYLINVAFGRAYLTRKLTVEAGKTSVEKFVLNAGALRVLPVLANGEPAPEQSTTFEVLSDERDKHGNRSQIVSNAKTGMITRLNAGLYQVVSTYGDANATVRADVTVEPGKLTDLTIAHLAAKVTFKLVARAGGEAIAETQWSISNAQGELVKESVGALPTHILATGNYAVSAKHSGRTYRRDFSIPSGEVFEVEVVAR